MERLDLDPGWAAIPVLSVFHDQWLRARGALPGPAQRPFSRDWETLLSDAGLTSAELRREATRDVRVLAAAGILRIKTPPRRPELIARVLLPLEREGDLVKLFGDIPPDSTTRIDLSQFDWEPELAFLRTSRSSVNPDDLLALNRFLRDGGRDQQLVPVKERSLNIFGDEKRLDAIGATSVFGDGRLSMLQLRAFFVAEPLPWRRGSGPDGSVLVLENAASWHSFAKWNQSSQHYAAVVYGGGYRFVDGIASLADLAGEIGAISRIDYFGDLDPEGLRIPRMAAKRAQQTGLPSPVPLAWAYQALTEVGQPTPGIDAVGADEHLEWLPIGLHEFAKGLFGSKQRIAQEWLGWHHLGTMPPVGH